MGPFFGFTRNENKTKRFKKNDDQIRHDQTGRRRQAPDPRAARHVRQQRPQDQLHLGQRYSAPGAAASTQAAGLHLQQPPRAHCRRLQSTLDTTFST